MRRKFMPRSFCLAVIAAFAIALLALSQHGVGAQSATKTVIVELAGEPTVVAKYRAETEGQSFDVNSYRQQIIAAQDALLSRASAAGIPFTVSGVSAPNGDTTANVQFRFNYVYNGITLEVPAASIAALEKLEGVVAVHEAEPTYASLDHAVDYTRAPQLYGDPPNLTQFDEMNTGGAHGEGMIVAVIDTGVDWTHPMFGSDPTPPQFGVAQQLSTHNQKVIYYLNLTAGVVSDDFGHGTHVAADIAGYLAKAPGPDGIPLTADDVEIHGVAPKARIMAYKTLSGAGTGLNPSTILALEDAVQPFTLTGLPKPVPHVINLSLGSTTNDPDSPTSVACDNATLAGVTVVAAAGNSGPADATLGSPASGRRVIAAGATLDPGSAPNSVDELGGRSAMKVFPFDGSAAISADVTANYVDCGLAETPDQVPDSVRGRIALIARGGSVNTPPGLPTSAGTGLFSNKVAFATAKGAIAVIIYNNVDGELTAATVRKSVVPAVGMSKVNGEYLKSRIGSPIFGAVSSGQIRLNRNLLFDPGMADFSSRGPVGGFGQVKPDVTAPGVNILSATVRVGGATSAGGTMLDPTGYISASGTSFASPITAGIALLVKQKHLTWTPAMIRASLMNTATNLRQADGTPIADGANTLNEQGAGLVDAFAAANAKAMMGAGTPGPTGRAPASRPFAIGVSPLVGTSPGNPDFSASYSFGAVPVAGVEGTATLTQAINIFDFANGAGAGTYQLAASNVRGVDGTNFAVKITNASGNAITSVDVPIGGRATFNVTTIANGAQIANPSQIQFYVTATRADGGQRLRMPFYYRAIAPTVTMAAPALNTISGTEVVDNPPVDINGAYQLGFAKPTTGATPSKLRVQESADGGATWTTLADVDAAQTTYNVNGRANGVYQYRVIGLYPVQYGLIAGPASTSKSVRVDRRVERDVTSLIQTAIVDGTLSFAGGVAQYDQTLRNASSTTIYPPLRFVITSVQSNSGQVRVMNADNGGNGTATSPAVFDYSATFGYDFTPNEVSGSKRLKFTNPASELFQFTATIYAHLPDPAFAQGSAGGASGGASAAPSGSESGSGSSSGTLGAGTLPNLNAVVLTFTVNPLTGQVSLAR